MEEQVLHFTYRKEKEASFSLKEATSDILIAVFARSSASSTKRCSFSNSGPAS